MTAPAEAAPPAGAPPLPGAPAAPPKPAVWPVFVGFLAIVTTAQLVGAAVLGGLFAAELVASGADPLDVGRVLERLGTFALSPRALIAGAAVNSTVLTAGSLAAARLAKVPVRARLRLGPGEMGPGKIAAGAVGAVALGQLCSCILSLAGLSEVGILRQLGEMIPRMPLPSFALFALLVGAGAPIGEELFFRGFMQTRLSERWHRAAAIGVTALLFGVMHLDPVQGAFAVVMGFYLGWLADAARSIRPAIAAHAANNCASLLLGRFLAPETTAAIDVVILAASAAVLGACVLVIVRRSAPRGPDGARAASTAP